jgi:hypothetical protein
MFYKNFISGKKLRLFLGQFSQVARICQSWSDGDSFCGMPGFFCCSENRSRTNRIANNENAVIATSEQLRVGKLSLSHLSINLRSALVQHTQRSSIECTLSCQMTECRFQSASVSTIAGRRHRQPRMNGCIFWRFFPLHVLAGKIGPWIGLCTPMHAAGAEQYQPSCNRRTIITERANFCSESELWGKRLKGDRGNTNTNIIIPFVFFAVTSSAFRSHFQKVRL